MALSVQAAHELRDHPEFQRLPHSLRQRARELASRLFPPHPLHEELREDTYQELQCARVGAFLPQSVLRASCRGS